MSKITFSFGRNWQDYLQHATPEHFAQAQSDLENWLGEQLPGASVLDIGCGSGIHSAAFVNLGARRVVSFDLDAQSVAATRSVREQLGAPDRWQVLAGSVLDAEFVESLGQFDVVYSWGVLHHTGALWQAVESAAHTVAPNGLLWIALYARGGRYERDLALKQRYNRAGRAGKELMEWQFMARHVRNQIRARRNPFFFLKYGQRGMSYRYDVKDWLGGLPYEVASLPEVDTFLRARGFDPLRVVPADHPPDGSIHKFLYQRRS